MYTGYLSLTLTVQVTPIHVKQQMWHIHSNPICRKLYSAGKSVVLAVTVVHRFFGKEVGHSKQRSLKLMLQPAWCSVCWYNVSQTQGREEYCRAVQNR